MQAHQDILVGGLGVAAGMLELDKSISDLVKGAEGTPYKRQFIGHCCRLIIKVL